MNPEDFERMAHDHAQLDPGLRVTMDLHVRMHANGAMSVSIPVDDEAYCLAVLRNAEDAVRRHFKGKQALVVPGQDVALPVRLA